MGPDYLMLSPEVMVCSVLFGAAARTPHPLYFSEQPRRLALHIGVRQCLARTAGGGRLDHRSAYTTTKQLHIYLFFN